MKKGWKKRQKIVLSILLYVLILAWLLQFDIMVLISPMAILQFGVGIVILSIPFWHKGITKSEIMSIVGQKGLEAGYIQTFLLLFGRLFSEKGYEELLSDIALSFRPVLYGLILSISMAEEKQDTKIEEEEVQSKEQTYEHFLDLGLTKREAQIAVLICKDFSNREIAEEFVISEATVKKHISNIFDKLGIEKREELKKV